jgi:hypothetical protein
MADASSVVVPGGAIPIATPQFAGGAAPVPSFGQSAGTPDPAMQVNDMAKQIMARLAMASQRKQFAGTPVPAAVPGFQDPNAARQIGMNTANPNAWGKQRLMAGVAANIQNAVAKQKQQKMLKAEADWSYMSSSLNELYAAQASNDPKAVAAAQQKVDVVLGDPKKLKEMAKALNQDWLNPEKTTVYGEALKKVTAQAGQQAQSDAQKQQAAQGLKGMFQKLLGQRQQPQLTPEQLKSMSAEIQAKAPTTMTGGVSMKDQLDAAKAVEDLARAEKELRATPDKYDFKTIKDSNGGEKIVAVDKTDPTKPYVEVKSTSGDTAKPGEKKYANDGKLEIVAGVPTGRVMHAGKYVAPGQEGYTKADADAVDLGLNAQGLSQKQKEKLVAMRASETAKERAQFVFHNVVNKQTGEVGEVSALEMAKNPSMYGGASEQEKVSARDSVHESLNTNFKALSDSLDKLPNGLDTETQALLKQALNEENPGMIETLMVNKVKQGASDEVLQYLTNIKIMQEDVMTLRSVGGMGAGSDAMRHAMVQTIPGAGTSSVREAKMQINAAKRTSDALFSRRPQSRLPDTGGEMEKQTYNGVTYQRKKGSNDEWTQAPK